MQTSDEEFDAPVVNPRIFFFMLVVGQLLHGMGGSPIVMLSVTFMDENVSQMASPVYNGVFFQAEQAFISQSLGVFMIMRNIVGPATGYLLGGMALRVYGDALTVDTST